MKKFVLLLAALVVLCAMPAAAELNKALDGDRLEPGLSYALVNQDDLSFVPGLEDRALVADQFTLQYTLTEGEDLVERLRLNRYEEVVEICVKERLSFTDVQTIAGSVTLTSKTREDNEGKPLVYSCTFRYTVEGNGESLPAAAPRPSDLLIGAASSSSSASSGAEAATSEQGKNPDTGLGLLGWRLTAIA